MVTYRERLLIGGCLICLSIPIIILSAYTLLTSGEHTEPPFIELAGWTFLMVGLLPLVLGLGILIESMIKKAMDKEKS